MAARLSFDERCVISAMVGVGASAGQIADELGRHSSTVRREINRAGGRGVYRAEDAQTEAEVRARRPKVPKLVTDPQLAEAVTQLAVSDGMDLPTADLVGRLVSVT